MHPKTLLWGRLCSDTLASDLYLCLADRHWAPTILAHLAFTRLLGVRRRSGFIIASSTDHAACSASFSPSRYNTRRSVRRLLN